MKSLKKLLLVGALPVFILILIIYRQQNVAKRESLETQTLSGSEICSLDYVPVCGEDRVTYANECAARKNAVQIAYSGTCRVEESLTEQSSGTLANTGTTTTASGITNDQYYRDLEAQCGDDSCCIWSVHTMKVGWYSLADNGECRIGEKLNSSDCSGSLQWCEPGDGTTVSNSSTTEPTGVAPTLQLPALKNVAPEWKRTPYYNGANNYGFSVPVGDYFSGFGAQAGASHTVGISSGTGVTSLDEAQVKVYYYKKNLPELANAQNGFYQEGDKTYLKLSDGSVMIEWDPTGKTVNTIIATIRNGSGSISTDSSSSN